jgi:DNA end-binding protein Ku
MFSGVQPQEGIDLDMLHNTDHSPIRYARICKADGKEIAWEDIVKGYEYKPDQYIELTEADFDKANPKKTQTVDIAQFANATEIDIRYFEKPYYLEPEKGGDKAYALLHAALEKSGKLAIARFVIRQKEHIGAIVPVGRALVLNQLRYPTDLRQAGELHFPSSKEITEKELEIALTLVKQETKAFIPEDFHDTYTEELEDIITAKVKGAEPHKTSEAPKHTTSADLMETLKASLKA